MGEAQKQLAAYKNRDKIKLGDKFRWSFANGYGTSGDLPKEYMRCSAKWQGDMVLTVCNVYTGRNGYGNFVNYYLNVSGVHKQYEVDYIVINGPDAFKMQRVV